MGSYNLSCGLSRLPIRHNDKVKLIPITTPKIMPCDNENDIITSFKSGCDLIYISDLFYPVGYQLDVIYNDYGGYEVPKSNKAKYIIDAWFNFSKEYNSKINDINDFLVILTHNRIQKEEKILIQDCKFIDKRKTIVSFFPILKEVWDESLKIPIQLWNTSKTFKFDDILKNEQNFILKILDPNFDINLIRPKYGLLNDEKATKDMIMFHSFRNFFECDNQEIRKSVFASEFHCDEKNRSFTLGNFREKLLTDIVNNKIDLKLFMEIHKEMLEMYWIKCVMEELNIPFCPIVSSGQDVILETHKSFNNIISGILSKISEEYEL